MHSMELEAEEREILDQVLNDALAKLEMEIRHTDRTEFRDQLKHRRKVLEGLLNKTLVHPEFSA